MQGVPSPCITGAQGPRVRQNRSFQFRTTFQWYNPSIFTENIYHHKKILVSFIPFAEFLHLNQISSPYFIDVIYALWVYLIHPLIFLASLGSKVVIARSGTGDKLPPAYKMFLTACSSSRASHRQLSPAPSLLLWLII